MVNRTRAIKQFVEIKFLSIKIQMARRELTPKQATAKLRALIVIAKAIEDDKRLTELRSD